MKKMLLFVKNKYILSLTAFIVWLAFFDRFDVRSQISLTQELYKLEEEKAFFKNQIEEDKKAMFELMHNPQTLEKFAREKYLMKKDDEEIFVIVPASE